MFVFCLLSIHQIQFIEYYLANESIAFSSSLFLLPIEHSYRTFISATMGSVQTVPVLGHAQSANSIRVPSGLRPFYRSPNSVAEPPNLANKRLTSDLRHPQPRPVSLLYSLPALPFPVHPGVPFRIPLAGPLGPALPSSLPPPPINPLRPVSNSAISAPFRPTPLPSAVRTW